MTAARRGLLARGVCDLRGTRYPVLLGAESRRRGLYPVDWRLHGREVLLDGDGVVSTEGPTGPYRNPVAVALYALGRHVDQMTGHADALVHFLGQARYLADAQDASGGWAYPVPVPRYGVTAGWYSAMAQGLAVSVFQRAAVLDPSRPYAEAARRAVALMLRRVEDGGCSHYDGGGRPFLEECPADPPTHVLNGAAIALIGLLESGGGGGRAARAATLRLAEALPSYDLGYWSRYDLRFRVPASRAYHTLHVSLLRVLDTLTGMPEFGHFAERWSGYDDRMATRLRAAAAKASFVVRAGRG